MDLKALKKIGQELMDIVDPAEDSGKPIDLTKGKKPSLQKKIIKVGNYLEEQDEESCSAELVTGLKELGVKIPWEKDGTEEKEWTVGELQKLNKKELEKVAKGIDIDVDDFPTKGDLLEEVLDEMGLSAEESEGEEEGEEEAADETDDSDDDDSGEGEEDEEDEDSTQFLKDTLDDTKKLADLKGLVEGNDEFKKLRKGLGKYKGLEGVRDLKSKMYKAIGVEEGAKPADKSGGKSKGEEKAKKKAKKVSRMAAAAMAIKEIESGETETKENLANRTDGIFTENGGNSNLKESNTCINMALTILTAWEAVTVSANEVTAA